MSQNCQCCPLKKLGRWCPCSVLLTVGASFSYFGLFSPLVSFLVLSHHGKSHVSLWLPFFDFLLLSTLSLSLHQLFDHPCIHIAIMMFLSLKALPSGSGIDPGPTRLPLTIYRSQTPDRDAPDSSKEKWKNRITPPERILGREIRARRECMFTSVKQLLEWSHFSFHVPLKHLRRRVARATKSKQGKKLSEFISTRSPPRASALWSAFGVLLGSPKRVRKMRH